LIRGVPVPVRRVALWMAAALLATVGGSGPPADAAPQAVPTVFDGPVYWGAYVPGAPFDLSLLDAFENSSGKKMSIVHWGQPWRMNNAFQSFQTAQFAAVRSRGAIPMVAWGSWELGRGADQPAFSLATIADGTYDAYITQWAQQAKAWGEPFLLRFDWEMNGWWQFPWAEQINGNHPGDYVRAWRHVHDIFAQQGATNATWVWCPNVSSAQTKPLANFYPGDQYVDWTCMDGYNFGTDDGNQWQSFSQVFGGSAYNGNHNTYSELLALAPSKPIVIAETASSEHGGSKAVWISDMLAGLPTAFPQIKGLVWFDWNDDNPALSWPLTSSDSARDAFAGGIVAPSYASNQFAALPSLTPIPVLAAAPQPAEQALDGPLVPAPSATDPPEQTALAPVTPDAEADSPDGGTAESQDQNAAALAD
jgi:hypothetical protein